jgi:hypothetical protein
MYLLGYHGNNLYPSSLRLFTSKQTLLEHLYEKWQETIQYWRERLNIERDSNSAKWTLNRVETFDGFIRTSSWRLYELKPDFDMDTKNIRLSTLAKWTEDFR